MGTPRNAQWRASGGGLVPLVGSLFQEELPAVALIETRRDSWSSRYPLLHLPEFDIQHLIQFLALQGMEHHDFVQAIHEFWRELPPRPLPRRSCTFSCNPVVALSFGWMNPIPPCIRWRLAAP